MVFLSLILLSIDLLLGALQYLTIMRPDIAHTINFVGWFFHAPIVDHFLAVKRIFCYVKGTFHSRHLALPFVHPLFLVH